MSITETDLLKQAIDTLTIEYRQMRESVEQWRLAYLNEVNRCDKLTQQVILLTTPMQTPVSTVETYVSDGDGRPLNVTQAITTRARFAEPRELGEWADNMLASGWSADAVAETIMRGAIGSDDSPEEGFEGPDGEDS